ncbi:MULTISPECIES: hypothetical protein [unclassified Siphonobacter]|uniref:hypothetical protein n=1 Tax=unclassified Siphonobacter TaxID=2635712 RepID=UPI000CA7FBF9|nr:MULTISPECIES: hypothetical protein [unclassified Siphonobacter]PKK37718.1 hypothetical protein BWI96_04420 [Siphonobacter sp. SORGH_AS_0500]
MNSSNPVALASSEKGNLKSYQIERVDEETGAMVAESKFLYLEGHPREYRFNGQNGQFNLYGERILTDSIGKPVTEFSFQPIAYRIFEDTLFTRSEQEVWAEFFFVDSDNCVASLMFNNTSVSELYRMMQPVFYERKTLCDLIITVKPEKVTSKADSGKSWYIARFSYRTGNEELAKEYRDFARDHHLYRAETLTDSALHRIVSKFYNRLPEAELVSLPESPKELASKAA